MTTLEAANGKSGLNKLGACRGGYRSDGERDEEETSRAKRGDSERMRLTLDKDVGMTVASEAVNGKYRTEGTGPVEKEFRLGRRGPFIGFCFS